MRITGNENLDPDFSKMEKHTRVLGAVAREDMFESHSQDWRLPRINPVCENCGKNQSYHIVMAYYQIIPFIKMSKTYHIVCGACGDKIELDLQEYLKVKPFMVPE